jgi:hypothetical protein
VPQSSRLLPAVAALAFGVAADYRTQFFTLAFVDGEQLTISYTIPVPGGASGAGNNDGAC